MPAGHHPYSKFARFALSKSIETCLEDILARFSCWIPKYRNQEGIFGRFSCLLLNYIDKADFQKTVHPDAFPSKTVLALLGCAES